jgi:hypothetical protein
MSEDKFSLLVRDSNANTSLKNMFEICPECGTKKIYNALQFALAQQVPKKLVLTLKSMATFGITTSATLPAPFQVVWDFTHRYNIKTCKQCYASTLDFDFSMKFSYS